MKALLLLLLPLACQAAITVDGYCAATSTSCTLSAVATGDLKLIFASETGTGVPTLPSGYTSVAGVSAAGYRVYCSVASSSGDTGTGTATSATSIAAVSLTGTSASTTAACATAGVVLGASATNPVQRIIASTIAGYNSLGTISSGTGSSMEIVAMSINVTADTCLPTGFSSLTTASTSGISNQIGYQAGISTVGSSSCTITSGTGRTIAIEVLAADSGVGSGTPSCQNFTDQGEPFNTYYTTTGGGTGYLQMYAARNMGAGNAYFVTVTGSPATTVTVTDSSHDTFYLDASTTDTSNSQTLWLFYALNVSSGANQIQVHYTGTGPWDGDAWIAAQGMECTNVALSNALDGKTGNFAQSNTITAGSVTPTKTNDLVIQNTWNDWVDPTTVGSFTAGSQSNITWALSHADRADGIATQWGVYASTSALNPTMSQTGTGTGFVSNAVFFKRSSSGTAFPSGIQIDAIKTIWVTADGVDAQYGFQGVGHRTEQFACPAADNAIVGMWVGANPDTLTGITDSAGNTWTQTAAANCGSGSCVHNYYTQNATVGPSQNITLAGSNGYDSIKLYCIRGAATTGFFDKAQQNSGTQTVAGNLTSNSSFSPTTSNGLVLGDIGVESNTQAGITTPSGGIFHACQWSQQSANPQGCDENNGWAAYLNPNTTAENWTWTIWSTFSTTAAGTWSSEIDAFEAPQSAGGCTIHTLAMMGAGCE